MIAVVGPTASGKTALAVALAKEAGGEVLCADSMQIYRHMPIATAAASAEEQQGVTHHLLEFLDPDTPFSVAEFVRLARLALEDIFSRGRVPVICGGTGLFVDSLLQNIQFTAEPLNSVLREQLWTRAGQEGPEALHQELMRVDPQAAGQIHPNNIKRVIRALELCETTGMTTAQQEAASRRHPSDLEVLWLGISYKDRQKLYHRINTRVDHMLSAGLADEARQISSYPQGATSRQAIGHKELQPYLKGEITLDEAAAHLKQETRRYAKRQLTWFRRNGSIHWLYPDENPDYTQEAISCAHQFLKGAADDGKKTFGL